MDFTKGGQQIIPAMHRIRFTKEEVKQALIDYATGAGQVLPDGSVLVGASGGGYYTELTITERLSTTEEDGIETSTEEGGMEILNELGRKEIVSSVYEK